LPVSERILLEQHKEFSPRVARVFGQTARFISRILDQGKAQGVFRADLDSLVTAHMILGSLSGATQPSLTNRTLALEALLEEGKNLTLARIPKSVQRAPASQLPTPILGYLFISVVRTCQLTIHSAGCIRIVTQIYSEEATFTKRTAAIESPQRCLEAFHDVPATSYFRWLPLFERAGSNFVNLTDEPILPPVFLDWRIAIRQQFFL
jgi:hypothetical protein